MIEFLNKLKSKEIEASAKVMAFMSYNPSIGRVLQKKGVETFQEMVIMKIAFLKSIKTEKEFDKFHLDWLNEFVNKIYTNKSNQCSVGQAQKAINVFLKLYVDWAGLPNTNISKKIIPFLHVPLDSIIMKYFKRNFKDEYKKHILPFKNKNYTMSLSLIGIHEYMAWQKFFRINNPKKPLLFDIIWAIERNLK